MCVEQQIIDTIVPGPVAAESVSKTSEKLIKKVEKEGGKRGIEIEGAADMGGLKFFCCAALEPAGNVDLLVETVKAMNKPSDPTEEERRGGAGRVGKIVTSFKDGVDGGLAMVAYVPSDLSGECSATEWLKKVVSDCGVDSSLVEVCGDCNPANWAKIQINTNPDADIFAIKFRDTAISFAYNFLRARGLFPNDDEESDDEYVFGDEDFPSAEDEVVEEVAEVVEEVVEEVAEVVAEVDELDVVVDTIVPGPEAAASIAKISEKKFKKVDKEGGKRGIEIEGAADMGGLKFFCCAALEADANVDLLVETVKAMNKPSDPNDEERRGGAGKVGKIVTSFKDGVDGGLAMVAYVPSDLSGECSATEWLKKVVSDCGADASLVEVCGDVNPANWAKVQINTNVDAGIFAIKFRDAAISHAYNFLRARGLFPEDVEDSDDEYVFGDEDFPEF